MKNNSKDRLKLDLIVLTFGLLDSISLSKKKKKQKKNTRIMKKKKTGLYA